MEKYPDADLRTFTSLCSVDPQVVIEALREIARLSERQPSTLVFSKATALFRHEDEDVRREAIFAVSLHWGVVASIDELQRVLMLEKDTEVLAIALRSVSRLMIEGGQIGESTIARLVLISSDARYDLEVRGLSYLALRTSFGYLSRRQLATSPDNLDQLAPDWDWVKSLTITS